MTTALELRQREVISYHPDNIKKLVREQFKLQSELKSHQEHAYHYTEALKALEHQIQLLKEKSIAIEKQIINREEKIIEKIEVDNKRDRNSRLLSSINMPIKLATSPIKALLDYLAGKLVGSVIDELKLKIQCAIKDLSDPILRELKEERKEFCDMRMQKCHAALLLLKEAILREDKRIHARINRIKQIDIFRTEAELEFIPALKSQPTKLCNQMREKIIALKKKYEEKFPKNQADSVEICLYELEDRVNRILQLDEVADEKLNSDLKNKHSQRHYLELCGFLWRMYDSLIKVIEMNIVEEQLANDIFSLLQEMHLNRYDDLPGDMAIGKSALVLYKSKNTDTGISTFNEIQNKKYLNAKTEFENALQNSPLVTNQIKAMGQKLLLSVELQKSKDIRFCSLALKMSKQLITPGEDTPQLFDEHLSLANKASGKPSGWKKVIGCMLGLAGLALIGLSVFATLATGGLAAPVSLLGITWGTGFLMAAYTFLAGVATFGFGEYLFLKGTRLGLSNRMYKYKEAVRQHSSSAGFFNMNQVTKKVDPVQKNTVPEFKAVLMDSASLASIPPKVQLKLTIDASAPPPPEYSPKHC